MKKIFFIIGISIGVYAIEVNQEIELTQYMNARYSANFIKNQQNILGVLPAGARGVVQEIRTFSSGNSGFLINVKDGSFKNQKVWVYYSKTSPSLKLVDEKKQETNDPLRADQVQTTRPTPMIREPVDAATAVARISQARLGLDKLKSGVQGVHTDCADCKTEGGDRPKATKPIVISKTPAGDLNAKIECSYKSDQGMTHAGKIKIEIENNKVKNIKASINGCAVDLEKFRQVQMPNKNIVLEDSNGCAVTITENLKVRGSHYTVLNFGMVPTQDCVKSCAAIEKKFWQIEMNPDTQTCY